MDDVVGAASGSEQDLQQFLDFASKYHIKFVPRWSISSEKLPSLDIYMTPRDDRKLTSIYYKDTTHIWTSGRHIHPSVNRPYHIVSFYRWRTWRRTCYVSKQCVLNFLFCTVEDSYLACHIFYILFYSKRVYFCGAKHVVPKNNLFGLWCGLFHLSLGKNTLLLPTTAFCLHSSKKLQTSFFVQLWL